MLITCDFCGFEEHHDEPICRVCKQFVVLTPEKRRLNELLETMDVPKSRFADLRWLTRNLGIRNEKHPNFLEARRLIVDALIKPRSI